MIIIWNLPSRGSGVRLNKSYALGLSFPICREKTGLDGKCPSGSRIENNSNTSIIEPNAPCWALGHRDGGDKILILQGLFT